MKAGAYDAAPSRPMELSDLSFDTWASHTLQRLNNPGPAQVAQYQDPFTLEYRTFDAGQTADARREASWRDVMRKMFEYGAPDRIFRFHVGLEGAMVPGDAQPIPAGDQNSVVGRSNQPTSGPSNVTPPRSNVPDPSALNRPTASTTAAPGQPASSNASRATQSAVPSAKNSASSAPRGSSASQKRPRSPSDERMGSKARAQKISNNPDDSSFEESEDGEEEDKGDFENRSVFIMRWQSIDSNILK